MKSTDMDWTDPNAGPLDLPDFPESPAGPALRPRNFDEYVGQEAVLAGLRISIEAALLRGDSLDHVLLHGPPGLGKTTLASLIAKAMEVPFLTTSGPVLEKGGDLVGILSRVAPRTVLFIDEIHRLPRPVEEVLYGAMEDFAIDVVFDRGPSARTFRHTLPPFTLVGATTRAGLLSSPLRDRFGIFQDLDFYRPDELVRILARSSQVLGFFLPEDAAFEIGCRSRGTPRIANRLLRRIRDYAQVKSEGIVTRNLVLDALKVEGIDDLGLNRVDRKVLHTIGTVYGGGPVGVDALAATLQFEVDTIIDVVEPYLLKEGLLARTPAGRKLTEYGQKRLRESVFLEENLL
jgi:Holliday junction DNA helicase RuvB